MAMFVVKPIVIQIYVLVYESIKYLPIKLKLIRGHLQGVRGHSYIHMTIVYKA